MRRRQRTYVEAAAWSAITAGALPWCRRCRTACLGHPVTPAAVEQLLALPEPVEDVDTARAVTASH